MINFEKNSIFKFLHTVIRIYILSHFDLESYIFKFFDSQMKLFEMKINIMILKEILSSFIFEKKKFDIQDLILICFEFRTLFDLKNRKTSTIKRCFRYLNKTVRIKFELRMLLHLCLRKNMISKNYRDVFIFLKREQNLEIYQDVIVFSEELIVNENWLQKVLAIKLIIVRMMILKQSKKRRAFFRRRKFDILIRSI
jgi:Golgi nucleoside diphosphatase